MKKLSRILLAALVCAGLFAMGRWSVDRPTAGGPPEAAGMHGGEAPGGVRPSLWTCPMHPQIRLPDPGDCPICSMDLVPVEGGDSGEGGEGGSERVLVMSPAARELARIAVAPVERKVVTRAVRMVGKIDFDETAVRSISAWVPGRLDRLFVDYTGIRVRAGDHLVRLYSPELTTAQEELLSARARLAATAGETSEFLAESNRRAYEGARDKLLLFGLTEEQVREIEERGTAEDHVMLTSPSTGVVIEKRLEQGAYVETGTEIYKVADLAHLWVRLDAYEQDLAWLRYGQEVEIEAEALPGEVFRGRISFIDPTVHERTRTSRVRVKVENRDGRRKPGMFVRALVQARLGGAGRVLEEHLAGKWISPMHPEIVKDGPGACDVCGMDLVPAEDLGLIDEPGAAGSAPLVVPATAVLVTGKRAVVYVEVPGAERPSYEGREILLGPRAGEEYVVLSGLEEGERVVVHGAFRIDSAMQILARPSMLSMPAEEVGRGSPEVRLFRRSLRDLYAAYLSVQIALAADDAGGARSGLEALRAALGEVATDGLPASQRAAWSERRAELLGALGKAGPEASLSGLRAAFADLSQAMLALERAFGHDGDEARYAAFCPMAFDGEGGEWLQVGETIANPYFGAEMLRCGTVRESFPPAAGLGSDR